MPSDDTNRKTKRLPLKDDEDGGLYETLQRFWRKSYAGDYIGLALLVVAFILFELVGEPFHSQFRLDDVRISHPHAEIERVGVAWLVLYAALLPAAILGVWCAVSRVELRKAHVTFLGLAISILMACFITGLAHTSGAESSRTETHIWPDLLKDAIGRPRPDLIARCKPKSTAPRNVLVTVDVCTETNHHTLHDGWRSWPSGHSSFAFSGLGWLALFFAAQTHAIRPRTSLVTVLVVLAPLIGAAMIAISRLEDYRHDVGDVVTGSILGFAIAYMNWRRYYPSLVAESCHEPHPVPKTGRTSPSPTFHRIRDEEEAFTPGPARYSIGGDGVRYSIGGESNL